MVMRRWMVGTLILCGMLLVACGANRAVSARTGKGSVSAPASAPRTCAPDLSLSGPWTVRTYSNCAQAYYSTDALIPADAANPVTLFEQEKPADQVGYRPVCSYWGSSWLSSQDAWRADPSVSDCTSALLSPYTPANVDPYGKSTPPSGYLAALRYKEQLSAPPPWAANLFAPDGTCAPGVFAVSQPGQGITGGGGGGLGYAAVVVRVYAGCEAAFRPLNEGSHGWAPFPDQAPPAGKCAVWLSGQWVLRPQGQCASA